MASLLLPDAPWRRFADSQDGVLALGQALAAGLSWDDVRTRVRRGEWRRLLRGAYLVDAELYEMPPARARIRAAALTVPDGVLCGRSAAVVLDLGGGADPDGHAVEVSVPSGRPVCAQRGLVVRQVGVPAEHITVVDGMRVTSPLWTVGDLVLWLGRMEAVGVLDAALHDGHLRPDDLAGLEPLLAHRPGAVAARRRLEECDGRAESPLETRVRLICADGGVPPDSLQHPVLDCWGDPLGYGDLAWTYARLIAEADGHAAHDRLPAAYRDRHRANDFRAAGWTIVRFTWADTQHPAYIVSVVRRALAAASPGR
jgi:hypothetical protein